MKLSSKLLFAACCCLPLSPAMTQSFEDRTTSLGAATDPFAPPPPVPPTPQGIGATAAPRSASPSSKAGAVPKRGIRYDERDGYTLAFVEADIRRVVDAVLGSMLGLDYNVDAKVQGNITLRTAKPVTADSLLPLLESALASVDAAILRTGNSYRVVSRADARVRAPMAADGGESVGGFANEVIELKNATAKEIARLLEQFLGKEVVAGTDAARNQVIIAGSAEERQAARAMITRFDVDALAGMNFALYRLENVDADTLMAELQKIFQPPLDIIGTRVRIVPLPRLRAVLVIAADRADFARIEPWIRRLDAGTSGKRKLYSYAVQNGRAREIAASLQQVLGVGSSQSGSGGSASSSNTEQSNQGSADGGTAPQLQLPNQAIQAGGLGAMGGGGVGPRIVPNDDNNSLLIYASGEEYDFVREVLEKIDRPVAQVLIEATLAEVTLSDDFSAGLDWSMLKGSSSIDLRNAATAAPVKIFPGFSYGYIGSSVQAVLNTLQSKTNVKVLSAPKLIVLNNQTASLQVGDQVPIVTQQAQSVAAPGAPVVNSIELRDTGVILKVTPRVNDSGTIILDIAQEVSDVAETTTSGINSPTIQQRRLTSTVATRSGQMVALGGLIRDRTTRVKSGIPLLSQIPVLGMAFGEHSDRGSRTELIILLTPTVIRSPEDIKGVMDELLDGLDATRPLIERAVQRQVGGKIAP